MDTVSSLFDLLLHIDKTMLQFIADHGNWIYALLFVIIFSETGLVFAHFLPVECLLTTQGPAIADLFCTWPALSRLDGVTVRFVAASMQDAIRTLNSLSAMSYMLR